ncbi:MAG: hypothetical protein ACRYHQ_11830 [Janthinobacterium lividum]
MSPPAAPAGAVPVAGDDDKLAWALAAVPLLAAVLLLVLAVLDVIEDLRWLSALTLLVSLVLVATDRRRLAAARPGGKGTGKPPSAWWFLVPPAYLWRRAAWLGRSKASFWAWVASAALAFVLRVVALVITAQAGAEPVAVARLPDCAGREIAADVRGVFDNLPAARQAGVTSVSLGGQAETGQGPGPTPSVRYCSGNMLASDNAEYAVDYSFELRQDDVIVRLQLSPRR